MFIDKPVAITVREAEQIAELASRCHAPVMSSSALRYFAALAEALAGSHSLLAGADCFGPMALEATQPGYFWYGIHTAEMLFAAMGPRCA